MTSRSLRLLSVFLLALLFTACGEDKASKEVSKKMPDKVVAVEALSGEEIYNRNCLPCHAEGPGHAGTMRLALRLGEEKSVLTKRNDLQAVYVKTIVRQGILLMPPFRPSEITDTELDALANFLAK